MMMIPSNQSISQAVSQSCFDLGLYLSKGVTGVLFNSSGSHIIHLVFSPNSWHPLSSNQPCQAPPTCKTAQ